MRVGRRRPVRALAMTTLAGALLLALWGGLSHTAAWGRFLAWIMTMQAGLHRQLAAAIRLVAEQGWTATWPLIGISLLYGVFHAAGPGHGKAVIATYLGTSRTRLGRGLFLSVASSLVQGAVAVLLVEVAANVLGYSLRRTQGAASQLENISFGLIALLGAVLALRSAVGLYRRRKTARGAVSLFSGGGIRLYCADCGGPHQVGRNHLDQPLAWRTALPIILSIGIRPCTGAVLVLLVAYSLGLRGVGVVAVLAMSLGTAATVGLLAACAVSFRQLALRLFPRRRVAPQRLETVFDVLGLLGGTVIGLMGAGLLQHGLAAVPHPLLPLG